jgi:hypothetical protein
MGNDGKIEAQRESVKDLFTKLWFNIPNYQRPYVWGKEEIMVMLEGIAERARENHEAEYFLGSFVLHDISQKNDVDVLDGQQRLTTLYLTLACIRDRMYSEYKRLTENKDCEKKTDDIRMFVDDLQKMIVLDESALFQTPRKIRLRHDVREGVDHLFEDYICTRGGVTKLLDSLKSGAVSRSVCSNHVAAIELINGFLEGIDERAADDRLSVDRFAQYLISKVIVIYVSTGSFDDAFRFFTILNTTGIPLSASDILKATNLSAISDPDEAKKWAAVWEDAESSFVNNGREGLDQLLSYIRAIYVKDKQRDSLLKEYSDRIYGATTPKLKKGVETLKVVKEYKEIYDKLILFDGLPPELAVDYRYRNVVTVMLKGLPSKDWVPLIMFWYKKFGSNGLVLFIQLLSNKVAADFILGLTPSVRIVNINKLLRAIDAAGDFSPLGCLLADPDNPLGYECERLYEVFSQDVYGKRYALYLLLRLELVKQSDHQALNLPYEISIEHILPQNPPADSSWCSIFGEEQRINYTHKIGNLMLIGRRKNTSLSNRDFSEKKSLYFGRSVETLPNSLSVMQMDDFNVEALENRHQTGIEALKNTFGTV